MSSDNTNQEQNPYRSPESFGAATAPSKHEPPRWRMIPTILTALGGGVFLCLGAMGAWLVFNVAKPGDRLTGMIMVGGLYGIEALLWFAAAQNWWKWNYISAIVWTALALSPLVFVLA